MDVNDIRSEPGPKEVVRGKQAVCSSSHPIVTNTMLKVLQDRGNAVDAGIAGSMVQASVQPHMTNHTGTVTFLYYEAKTGITYQLNSSGTLVPDLPPFRPMPAGSGVYAPEGRPPPMAAIPGFMPGMKALFERFATRKWADLCEAAIHYSEEGHEVSSYEYGVLNDALTFNTFFPSGRKLFTPDGFTPRVGERFKNPDLAGTMRRTAAEGPDYMITGGWAQEFVQTANDMGWEITPDHMTANPPRWVDPLRFEHNGHEIVQLSPPERQGVFCALVLGILKGLDIQSRGHYTESAEALYCMAQALRWADFEVGFVHDPETFHQPLDRWLAADHHQAIAGIIGGSLPKIDLSDHVRHSHGGNAMHAGGYSARPQPPTGSCELSIVDRAGNWVQMMNTLQSGGIPGMVIGGVPMVGSHAVPDMRASIAGWIARDTRLRLPIGNTLVMKEGKPWLSLGTPGNVYCTMPQVLSNILDYDMEPYDACVAPRMQPLDDDYTLTIESRLPEKVVQDIARLGVFVKSHPPYDWHMGSFQMCWRDAETGLLNSSTGPRRAGRAAGY